MRNLFAVLAGLLIIPAISANDTRRDLKRGNTCEWDALFAQGTVSEPCGVTRGTVLYAEGHFPKIKARIQGTVWKGKTFQGDGTFINRWIGFEAVMAGMCVGTSWFDGQPCIVSQYAADAKVFGGDRDELRQIGPGAWLGRSYDGATGAPKNYFLLEAR